MAEINDEGFEETEEVLADTEEEINNSYKTAITVAAAALGLYIANKKSDISTIQTAFDSGETTESEYTNSLINTLATGSAWFKVKNTVSNIFTSTSASNKKSVFSSLASVFAINHNYGTYEVEKSTGIDTGYTLYDKNAVEYLFKGGEFYPSAGVKLTNAIKTGKTKAWNKKQIQSAMIQSIKSGEGANKLAKRIATTVGEKNKASDIRNARTMTTSVQNAGRKTAYERASEKGITVEKQWRAIHDDRTRHEHRILDNQHVPLTEKFKVGGEEIDYPADPSAPPHLVYNCRCRLTSYIPKYAKADNEVLNSDLGDMTYEEWKYRKTKVEDAEEENNFQKVSSGGIVEGADETQSFDELEQYMLTNMGMEMDESVKQLDFQSVREGVQGIEYVKNEFPQAESYFTNITTYSSNNNSNMRTSFEGVIKFNSQNYNTRENALLSHIDNTHYHPDGYNCYASGSHEAGHVLIRAIIDKNSKNISTAKYDWYEKLTAKRIVNEAYSNLQKNNPKYKNVSLETLREQISGYSMKTEAETISEAVSDYSLNNEGCAPLALEIWKVLKKELG